MAKNTVYVIGAGASSEAGLPIGKGLKDEISKLFTSKDERDPYDHDIKTAYKASAKDSTDVNSFFLAAKKIETGLSQTESIDNFIHRHRDDENVALCGKLAIVKSILAAEKSSHFNIESSNKNPAIDYESLVSKWYTPFFQSITKGCTIGQLKDRFESITLIIFNYDRCIEHFLYSQLIKVYACTKDQAAELVNDIKIYHPYGDVGSLPWCNRNLDKNRILNFGEKPHHTQLLALAQGIKTFTEGNDPDASEKMQIRTHMGKANRVVFLGFAFDTLNMQLINSRTGIDSFLPKGPSGTTLMGTECFATAAYESTSNQEIFRERINCLFKGNVAITLVNSECGPFFHDYRESLSFPNPEGDSPSTL